MRADSRELLLSKRLKPPSGIDIEGRGRGGGGEPIRSPAQIYSRRIAYLPDQSSAKWIIAG